MLYDKTIQTLKDEKNIYKTFGHISGL